MLQNETIQFLHSNQFVSFEFDEFSMIVRMV